MQPPRLKLGLALVSPLVFVLLTTPNLSAARHTVSKSIAVKKVSTVNGKTHAAPKSAGKATVTGTTKAKPVAKGSAGSSAKNYPKASAASAKGPKKSSSGRAAKGSARTASRTAPKRPQKTVYKQQQPEPERIRDIQQALSDHGYPLEVNGAWDATTVDALKKFQTAQKIDNLSGKGRLDSMTLIALGLGPKREPTSGATEEPRPGAEGKLP